jgi:hypothetical protein
LLTSCLVFNFRKPKSAAQWLLPSPTFNFILGFEQLSKHAFRFLLSAGTPHRHSWKLPLKFCKEGVALTVPLSVNNLILFEYINLIG